MCLRELEYNFLYGTDYGLQHIFKFMDYNMIDPDFPTKTIFADNCKFIAMGSALEYREYYPQINSRILKSHLYQLSLGLLKKAHFDLKLTSTV